MIKIHLSRILEEKDMTQSELTRLTKIRPGTINAYYHGYVLRMNVEDLNKICHVLKCRIEDLLEHIPDREA